MDLKGVATLFIFNCFDFFISAEVFNGLGVKIKLNK